MVDWHSWHEDYDRPDSALAHRLRAVQTLIKQALDDAPAGPLRIVSLCAGQGRDLLEVLAEHPRRDDVRARLVELDPRNAAVAAETVNRHRLTGVEVVTGDASLIDHYADLVPADIVVACGIFGNITDEDIERAIGFLPQLTKTGGTVLWTRGRTVPDRVPLILNWFDDRGFDLVWVSPPDVSYGVGAHRFTAHPEPLVPGEQIFTFVGSDVIRAADRAR
ncbi:class I SAM-dependent methyltransferase [Mycolicibacterium nivoides]|uniref:class I SAM-dependent methyltransferase n=1 Tax=Mycolicibacterium nivoides TaxID=2487344 RepID=UPI0008D23D73|nr:class I SAM-dependent methyltransferase [Mycolicibacterium nivoides]MBN3508458.1 class I SAM-dependent methyltransferase [Mycolicibacterium septicum]QRY44296.1 class I SAM-dependent methyltransferase [Mycolicibacterium boenickei]SER91722.1 Putative methyltransferase [Mycobacterium sp. 88mf]SFF50841.1 Putative methyltransferase [Mycobacterium sp. 455mf]